MIAGLILIGSSQTQAVPSATPKELGESYAQALMTANTNLAATCLLPLRAYSPMAIDPDGKLTAEDVRQYHAKYLRKRLRDVEGFKKEAAQLGLNTEAISKVTVQVNPPKKNHKDPQVLFWFHSGIDRWKCEVEGCFEYEDGWYLYDIHWLGKDKAPQNDESEKAVTEQYKALDQKERRTFLHKLTADKMDQFIIGTVRDRAKDMTPDQIQKSWENFAILTGDHFEKWGEKSLAEKNPLTAKTILALLKDSKRDFAWKVAFHGYLKVILMQSEPRDAYEIGLSKEDVETLRKTIPDMTIGGE